MRRAFAFLSPLPTRRAAFAAAARCFAALLLAATLATCAPSASGPALWRITDADSEIWLFGSVHLLPSDLKWRTARIDAAFAGADELVFETDASDAGGAEMRRLAAALGRPANGPALSSRLDLATRARLARVLALEALDAQRLEPLRPWLAALTLSLTDAVRHGARQEAGVEAVLYAEALRTGKRLTFLETPEQQIRTLADLGEADQLRLLTATLRQIEEEPDSDAALNKAWAAGDVVRLDRLLRKESSEAGPAVYAALLSSRNARWAEAIARRLDGGGHIFIAVGAAHLIGPDGVVARLRARGIHVEGP
jgi:uncharacterized protein